MRVLVLALCILAGGAAPAAAWWSYAEWGMSPSQLASASGGRAVPCRADAAVCASPAGGRQPTHFVESVTMVGLPASVSFAFDESNQLVQTVVLFPGADLELIASLLQGIRGTPAEAPQQGDARRVWRDERRGTLITATPVERGGVVLLYRPLEGR